MEESVNFTEAVNSGKKFRPIGHEATYGWCHVDANGTLQLGEPKNANAPLSDVEFFNCRFELKMSVIQLTEKELDNIKAMDNEIYQEAKKNLFK